MSNSSTSAGYLTPVSAPQAYDETLERELSQWVRALSGLPASMVRPRWTATQAAIPAADVNWCGFGITDFSHDDSPAFIQAVESAQMWRHEVIECMASFYGPGGQQIATVFRDGLQIPQNNDELSRVGLSFQDASPLIPFPELINNQWVRRYDITVRLRRKVIRDYGIKSILSAPAQFFGE
ncbi:phage neck terminator protein [Cronobacter turicensis]|uniref:phage neck terminator protein n=1 Tax=Cronobacter turicensis TaxID=413502 RepID=UPI003CEB1ACE